MAREPDPCRGCRWRHVQRDLFQRQDDARCAHPRLERPPVEAGGMVRHPTTREARANLPGFCGPRATLYEPRGRAAGRKTA